MHVLVVDDDEETLEVIAAALEGAGHAAELAQGVHEAHERLAGGAYDVVVLDVMLPDGSGLRLCETLRRSGSQVPILFLSARGAVGSRVEGLEAGGDDYLAKPFALKELLARVRALGRRGPGQAVQVIDLGGALVDVATRQVRRDGAELPLTAREWSVLHGLIARRGHIVSYETLQDLGWGEVSESARSSLEVIVARLRKKLGGTQTANLIRTVRGQGYTISASSGSVPPGGSP